MAARRDILATQSRRYPVGEMDFDLRQLEIFCKVVERESFTRAAADVHLTQASVSERVANLERSIGVRLLDRLGRRVAPTAIGRVLYERAMDLLKTRRDICLELQELLGVERGTLVIGASTIPGECILPGEIARFRERHGSVLVRVLAGDTTEVVQMVADGSVELGFVGSAIGGEALHFEPVWDDELVLAVPAGHRLAGRDSVALRDLGGEPFVLREPGSGTRRTMERAFADAAADAATALTVVAELGSTAAVKRAVVNGLGLAFVSRRALELEVEAGLVHGLSVPDLELGRHVFLVRDPRRSTSPLCERFMAHVLGGTPD